LTARRRRRLRRRDMYDTTPLKGCCMETWVSIWIPVVDQGISRRRSSTVPIWELAPPSLQCHPWPWARSRAQPSGEPIREQGDLHGSEGPRLVRAAGMSCRRSEPLHENGRGPEWAEVLPYGPSREGGARDGRAADLGFLRGRRCGRRHHTMRFDRWRSWRSSCRSFRGRYLSEDFRSQGDIRPYVKARGPKRPGGRSMSRTLSGERSKAKRPNRRGCPARLVLMPSNCTKRDGRDVHGPDLRPEYLFQNNGPA